MSDNLERWKKLYHSEVKMNQTLLSGLDRIAKSIHYPECWDTACYPTLEHAIVELFECTNDDCKQLHNEVL